MAGVTFGTHGIVAYPYCVSRFIRERGAMASLSTTVEINRPIEEVFDYLTNLDNAPEWSVEIVDVRHDGPFQLGATGHDVRMMGKKKITMPWTVSEFTPPHRMVLDYTDRFQ